MADYNDLSYALAGFGRAPNPYDLRRKYAYSLLQGGMDTSPIASPWQGAARLAQALVGGMAVNNANEQEQAAKEQTKQQIDAANKIAEPSQRLAAYSAIDPELGMKYGAELAVNQAKLAQEMDARKAAGNDFVAGYGLGGGPQTAGTGPYGPAIAGIESNGQPNGGYSALGPPATPAGNRALGKYQVMDFNVGPWTQEVLGKAMTPQEFLQNPQAQDAVFKAKFGQFVQQTGSPQGAAAMWFSGQPNPNATNVRDVNGVTPAQYLQRFNGQLPPGTQPQLAGTPNSAPQPQPLPQGANVGQPPAPNPQTVSGPTVVAQPQVPIPDVPKPDPDPAVVARARQLMMVPPQQGGINAAQAIQMVEQDRNARWQVARDQARMQYEQQVGDRSALRAQDLQNPNAEQSLSSGFADRMLNSNGIVQQLQDAGTNFSARMRDKLPFGVGNMGQSSEYQQYKQARDDFINAQLRRESGAAIAPSEYENADRQYFPQPGDSREVIAQKARNRQLAVEGMIRNAGPKYQPSPTVQGGGNGPSAGGPPPPPPGFKVVR